MEINMLEGTLDRIALNIDNNRNILVEASAADQGDQVVLATCTGNGFLQIAALDAYRHRVNTFTVHYSRHHIGIAESSAYTCTGFGAKFNVHLFLLHTFLHV
jgi:hypothetical protein